MTRRSRNEIGPLILELKEACRRPLFTEICLDETRQATGLTNIQAAASAAAAAAAVAPETLSQSPVLSSSDNMKQPQEPHNKRTWKEVSLQLVDCCGS
jgi:hypothetical protein